jgi:hypothetical protein
VTTYGPVPHQPPSSCPRCHAPWERTELTGEAHHGGGYRVHCHECDHEWDDRNASHGDRQTARREAVTLPGDLRRQLADHPLLTPLNARQLDTIVGIVHGTIDEPRLPADGETWTGQGLHAVEVIQAGPGSVYYRVVALPDGQPAGLHAGPWRSTMYEFLNSFDPPAGIVDIAPGPVVSSTTMIP